MSATRPEPQTETDADAQTGTDAGTQTVAGPAAPRPPLSVRILVGLLSTVLALGAAEMVAGVVRGHAFPFLNIFEADETYGVRLEPHAETATRSREGRVTEIATNALGFRDDEWVPAAEVVPGRVLLLGDSQMFGYGVDVGDGVASQLELELGGEVLNAAVPTWGPGEYVAALRELGPVYRPETVVFVANLANDWFEAKQPNTTRTTARDGWASHRVAEQEPATDFPGRRFLMGRSHLVFAIRELLADREGLPPYAAASAQRLVNDLKWLRQPHEGYRSRVSPHLAAAKEACEALGCTVVAVSLPMDVQVDEAEWAKYDTEPLPASEIAALHELTRAFMADARDLGVRAVDLRPLLVAHSPGLFLPDDYHLSPQGHQVLAKALAAVISRSRQARPTLAHTHLPRGGESR